MSRAKTVAALEAQGVIAVIRLEDPVRFSSVVDALARGEVRAVEITMTMPGALEALAALPAGERLLIGAGSVLDGETARLAILAGARFIVSPIFRPGLVELCHRYDVAAIPGGYTPTEILAAWEAGADLVKLFPAGTLGPGYLKDLRGPSPHLRLVPTGGVSAENAGAFLQAGAAAVGVGGALIGREATLRSDYGQITAAALRLVQAVRAARAR